MQSSLGCWFFFHCFIAICHKKILKIKNEDPSNTELILGLGYLEMLRLHCYSTGWVKDDWGGGDFGQLYPFDHSNFVLNVS